MKDLIIPALLVAGAGFYLYRYVDSDTQSESQISQYIHEFVNQARVEEGHSTLGYDLHLEEIAYAYSKDMNDRNFFDHEDPDGNNHVDRMAEAGYSGCLASGENLAFFSAVTLPVMTEMQIAEQFFNMWMDSPGHRENLMRDYTVEGIGVYRDGNRIFATQLFCRKLF